MDENSAQEDTIVIAVDPRCRCGRKLRAGPIWRRRQHYYCPKCSAWYMAGDDGLERCTRPGRRPSAKGVSR